MGFPGLTMSRRETDEIVQVQVKAQDLMALFQMQLHSGTNP